MSCIVDMTEKAATVIRANTITPFIPVTAADLIWAEALDVNSTRNGLMQEVEHIFLAGGSEVFADGMESEFSRSLTSAIKKHGDDAISALADLILSDKADPEVASEALRWIGYIDDADSYDSRLALLIRSLECSSAWIRDGATLGLSYLGDLSALSALVKAITHERYELLCRNMGLTIADLQNSNRGAHE